MPHRQLGFLSKCVLFMWMQAKELFDRLPQNQPRPCPCRDNVGMLATTIAVRLLLNCCDHMSYAGPRSLAPKVRGFGNIGSRGEGITSLFQGGQPGSPPSFVIYLLQRVTPIEVIA